MDRRWVGGAVAATLVLASGAFADEASAVATLEKLKARVERDEKQPGNPVVGVRLRYVRVTAAALKVLKELKRLRTLDLKFVELTDTELKEVKELKGLQSLGLNSSKVTDAGLKHLMELGGLQRLGLDCPRVTDAGLKELKGLKDLKALNVRDT